ncbi:membrane biogenesis protein AsmA [uncultured Veillonella sp.]|uniref:membrane biogenesis protein AsmA n=1 Tax=uncultured Veillonella sp. TaxID=159268 RepID=UPI0028DC5DE6|nr:membrane biogenesis protein AsmA [uncultured Veillonella sp.]
MKHYMRSYWTKYKQLYKKGLKGIAAFLAIGAVVFFVLATIASRGMGVIFNEVMARQTMMRGTVTVESLSATPWGTLSFTNLVWTDPDGRRLITVPDGKIRVNMWDVVTRNFKASAINGIELNDAIIVVDLDENNRLDFVPASPDVNKPLNEVEPRPKPPKKTTQDRQEELAKKVRNFNWQGQHLDLKIRLRNSQLEVFNRNRHYVMKDVNARIDLDSNRAIHIDMETGKFGGTAIGDGLVLKGRVDLKDVLKHRMPQLDLQFDVHGVDPSSLGFGENIHDAMTLLTKVTGDFNRPFAKGRVTMPILRIPALTFDNVVGDVTYQDGILNFSNVNANVFNGKLEAKGVYNLDTRAYTITGIAKDLDSSIALKTPEFLVPVSANLNFKSDGMPRDMEVWGNFWSGEGHYMLIPIQSITGNFHNKGRHLSFSDVKVNTKVTSISTNALRIDDGQLTMGPLNITSHGGSNFILYDEDSFDEIDENMDQIKEGMKEASENSKRASESAKGLKDIKIPDDVKGSIKDLKRQMDSVKDSVESVKIN